MLLFKQIETEGISQLSYFIGDTKSGTAAVIDPVPCPERYLSVMRHYGVSITHVFETHIHADYMSGARELVKSLGPTAGIYASGEGGAAYEYEVNRLKDGQSFCFGATLLTVRHTPGHTPEHVAFEVAEASRADKPWAVISGDALFVGSAGRPDLLGEAHTESLVAALHQTLFQYFAKLDPATIVYPCHGAGSACGASIGDRPATTIGRELQMNPFFRFDDLGKFKEFVHRGVPPVPAHYPHLKKVNASGRMLCAGSSGVSALQPGAFEHVFDSEDLQLVDTRSITSFAGAHIPGAIHVGEKGELSVWAGSMLDFEKPLLLVLETDSDIDRVAGLLANTGFMNIHGYLAGGMNAWVQAGKPIEMVPQLSVGQFHQRLGELQPLDVRTTREFEQNRIPGAEHLYVADLRDAHAARHLDPAKHYAVYCGSGYRASIAASVLLSLGLRNISTVVGSMLAWNAAGYEVESGGN